MDFFIFFRLYYPKTGEEVTNVSKSKNKGEKKEKRDLRRSAPIAGVNPTDPQRNAQDPMADPLEMRMKGESHQM